MRAASLLALMMLAACQQPQKPGSTGALNPDIFEDLPAPKDAVYRDADNESFSYRGGSFRCGRFVYDFKGSQEEATAFFKETMTTPPYNWTLAGEDQPAAGTVTLVFTKNEDRCTVDVDRLASGARGKDQVVIIVQVNHPG
jgi:hypothetical protein